MFPCRPWGISADQIPVSHRPHFLSPCAQPRTPHRVAQTKRKEILSAESFIERGVGVAYTRSTTVTGRTQPRGGLQPRPSVFPDAYALVAQRNAGLFDVHLGRKYADPITNWRSHAIKKPRIAGSLWHIYPHCVGSIVGPQQDERMQRNQASKHSAEMGHVPDISGGRPEVFDLYFHHMLILIKPKCPHLSAAAGNGWRWCWSRFSASKPFTHALFPPPISSSF